MNNPRRTRITPVTISTVRARLLIDIANLVLASPATSAIAKYGMAMIIATIRKASSRKNGFVKVPKIPTNPIIAGPAQGAANNV